MSAVIREGNRVSLELYRPSNATEGDGFLAEWCGRCALDMHCKLVSATMRNRTGDPNYPVEWVRGPHGPRCLAFVPVTP